MDKKVRTRFAPSPTGYLHVGGLRAALFGYLYAKQNEGDFLLRIEDTDQARYIAGSEKQIIDSLHWAGIIPDEGVMWSNGKLDQKGEYGPYIQSQRVDIYKKHAEQLVQQGKAYKCYCSAERIEKLREEQTLLKQPPRYDKRCLSLSENEKKVCEENGESYVIRFSMPEDGQTKWKDLVYKKMSFDNSTQEDFVIMKSDGFPTYNFANVIDDHLMQISHVTRGEEFLSSTPKHIALYLAFGWDVPQFAHLPLLLNKDRSKLSKRKNDVAVDKYIHKGYLPEAMINFLALLGWNPKDDREMFSLDELIKEFDFAKVNKTGAVFDTEKLDWINGHYIREKSDKEIYDLALPFLIEAKLIEGSSGKYKNLLTGKEISEEYIIGVVRLGKERMKKLEDISELVHFLFVEIPEYDSDLLAWKKMEMSMVKDMLNLSLELISATENFESQSIKKVFMDAIEAKDLKVGELLWPFRVALSGKKASPDPFDIAQLLGKELAIKRIEHALSML